MNEFDDLADLDDVFGPLRSVARPAELSQESATVDLMVNAHRTSEGKHMLTSRRARIATLVATGVLGFGGMAAASPKLGGDDPEVEKAIVVQQDESTDTDEESVAPEPVAEPVTEPVAEPVTEPVVEPVVDVPAQVLPAEELPAEDDLETDSGLLEFPCKEGNHGKTVSAVARGDYDLGESPESVTVTDAAHSSCGKDEKPEVGGPDSEVEQPEVDEPEIDDDSDDSKVKADRPDKSDRGAEKAANGNGNGNRNRDD